MKRIAVIDTGTNSTRLLIADVEYRSVKELDRMTTITRLGEGVDRTGRLNREAKERVLACISHYASIISQYEPLTTHIIATSSVRDAEDGEDFIKEIANLHSYDYRILSGEEEARLSFSGATFSTSQEQKTLLFDVGGGSTEIVAGKGADIEFVCSMRLGCVRLKERFLGSDPASVDEIQKASGFIDGILADSLDPGRISGIECGYGVAGTVTTLAAIDLGLKTYDRELVHGHEMTAGKVEELFSGLAALPVVKRMEDSTMEKGRADVIVAGALIVTRLLRYAGLQSFLVSERDILDGAALAVFEGKL
ncbi:MAG: Ppx/GppA phosphatase family protein [Thermoleophilia bacterium]|jgi:exopolyphosphatase/guanosine-5'-triphosphate,3'-diphosphate pyrophosphatase